MLSEKLVCDAASLAVLDEIKARFLEGPREDETDRRHKLRHAYPYSVALQQVIGDLSHLGPPIVAAGRDLSLWGISADSPTPFEIGDQVMITFQTKPRQDVPIVRMLGVVRHCKLHTSGQVTLGCEFLKTLSKTEATPIGAAN